MSHGRLNVRYQFQPVYKTMLKDLKLNPTRTHIPPDQTHYTYHCVYRTLKLPTYLCRTHTLYRDIQRCSFIKQASNYWTPRKQSRLLCAGNLISTCVQYSPCILRNYNMQVLVICCTAFLHSVLKVCLVHTVVL